MFSSINGKGTKKLIINLKVFNFNRKGREYET